MDYLKPVKTMMMLAPFCLATQTLADVVEVRTHNQVELILLDPSEAGFSCVNNDVTARIEINDDTPTNAVLQFPEADVAGARPIVVRRGDDAGPRRSERDSVIFRTARVDEPTVGPTSLSGDWKVLAYGSLDLCVGLATVTIVQGNLAVFVQVGSVQGHALDRENVLDAPVLEYSVAPSNFHPLLDSLSEIRRLRSMAPVRNQTDLEISEGARTLGVIYLQDQQSAMFFGDPNDPDGTVESSYRTRVTMRIELVERALAPE